MSNETNLPSQYDTDYGYDKTYDPAFITEQQIALDEASAQVLARANQRPASPSIRPDASGDDQPAPGKVRPEYLVPISTQDVVMNQPVLTTVTTQEPETHLALSFFTCLCCCWPLGLVAIILSLKAKSAVEYGSYDVARSYAEMAKRLSIAGVIVGGVIAVTFAVAVTMFNSDSY
ncbi:hypothetical protein SNE40_015934 [Patella caerulea]|uniref:Uncharacterized protein n=1 Tax=Patella caerulea TaxID=87958 RepID=A0AAN8JAY0_PATCE